MLKKYIIKDKEDFDNQCWPYNQIADKLGMEAIDINPGLRFAFDIDDLKGPASRNAHWPHFVDEINVKVPKKDKPTKKNPTKKNPTKKKPTKKKPTKKKS